MGAGASSSAAYVATTQASDKTLSTSAASGGAAFLAASSTAVAHFLAQEYDTQRRAVESLVVRAAEASGVTVHFFSAPTGRGRAKVRDAHAKDEFELVASSLLLRKGRTISKQLPTAAQATVLQAALEFSVASGNGGRLVAAEVTRVGILDGVLLAEIPSCTVETASSSCSSTMTGRGKAKSGKNGKSSPTAGELAVSLWATVLSERLETIRRTQEANAYKEALCNIADAVSKVAEGHDAVKRASAAAVKLIPRQVLTGGVKSDLVRVWLSDHHAGELVLADTDGGEFDGIRIPIDHSLAGETLRSGDDIVLCVREAQEDPRFSKVMDEAAGVQTMTSISIAVPMDLDHSVVGHDMQTGAVVQFVNTKRQDSMRPIDHFDLVQAEDLHHSALATMLHIRHSIIGLVEAQRQRQAVQAVAALIGTLAESVTDLSDMLELEIVGVMDCEECTFFFLDDAHGEMWAPPTRARTTVVRVKLGQGIVGHVAQIAKDSPQEVMIWTENAPQSSPHWNGEQTEGFVTRNLMLAPVYSSGKDPSLLGIIQIVNKTTENKGAVGRRKSFAGLSSNMDEDEIPIGNKRTRRSLKMLEEDIFSPAKRAPKRHFTSHDGHLLETLAESISGHLQRLVGNLLLTKAKMDMQEAGDLIPAMMTQFYANGSQAQTYEEPDLLEAIGVLQETHSLGEQMMSPTVSTSPASARSSVVMPSIIDVTSWEIDYWALSFQDELTLFKQAVVEFGLPMKLFVSHSRMAAFLNAIKSNYRQVPYHNFEHAVSTLHYCFKFMHAAGIHMYLEQLDLYALLVAAVCHDCDHRGFTNQFEVVSQSELAIRYNDSSPLENHHCAKAFQLAIGTGGESGTLGSSMRWAPSLTTVTSSVRAEGNPNIFQVMSKEAFQVVRQRMIAGILSTDMRHHGEHVKQLQTLRLSFLPRVSSSEKMAGLEEISHTEVLPGETRQKLVELVLHAADLGSAFMPTNISQRWTRHLNEEFTLQVEQERALGLPVTAFMDGLGNRVVAARAQVGFYDFVVHPLFDPLHKQLGSGLDDAAAHFEANKAEWAKVVHEELG